MRKTYTKVTLDCEFISNRGFFVAFYLNRYLALFVALERFSAIERIRLALTKTDAIHSIKQLMNQDLLAI